MVSCDGGITVSKGAWAVHLNATMVNKHYSRCTGMQVKLADAVLQNNRTQQRAARGDNRYACPMLVAHLNFLVP